MKTQDRQSLVVRPFLGEHARTPPSAFPFLHITMSKSPWACSGSHTPEPPMEANPPSGVNDSRRVPREDPSNLTSVRKSRAVAYNPAGDASNPARLPDLRLGPRLVKRWARQNLSSRLCSGLVLSRPHSCPIAPPLSNRKGEVTIPGTVWLIIAEGTEGAALFDAPGCCGRRQR